ncbi:hypothetical protein [Mycolicibacterium sp. PAM1]|nr:hypothetical protein [Mycolicibacterium sp. PAM1]
MTGRLAEHHREDHDVVDIGDGEGGDRLNECGWAQHGQCDQLRVKSHRIG